VLKSETVDGLLARQYNLSVTIKGKIVLRFGPKEKLDKFYNDVYFGKGFQGVYAHEHWHAHHFYTFLGELGEIMIEPAEEISYKSIKDCGDAALALMEKFDEAWSEVRTHEYYHTSKYWWDYRKNR